MRRGRGCESCRRRCCRSCGHDHQHQQDVNPPQFLEALLDARAPCENANVNLGSLSSRVKRKIAHLRRPTRLDGMRRADPAGVALAERVRAERLTFLGVESLIELHHRVREIESAGVPGSIVEAGCALGGSAIVLAAAKAPDRPMHVHDVFGMIPPPGERDGADVHARYAEIRAGGAEGFQGDTYYGYQSNLKNRVSESFARLGFPTSENNVELVEGLFEDTIRPSGPVAFGHIDGDWYESVKVCLERLWPVLSPGGVLVIDDYDAWSGCRTAVDEWLQSRDDVEVQWRSRVHLVKQSA